MPTNSRGQHSTLAIYDNANVVINFSEHSVRDDDSPKPTNHMISNQLNAIRDSIDSLSGTVFTLKNTLENHIAETEHYSEEVNTEKQNDLVSASETGDHFVDNYGEEEKDDNHHIVLGENGEYNLHLKHSGFMEVHVQETVYGKDDRGIAKIGDKIFTYEEFHKFLYTLQHLYSDWKLHMVGIKITD